MLINEILNVAVLRLLLGVVNGYILEGSRPFIYLLKSHKGFYAIPFCDLVITKHIKTFRSLKRHKQKIHIPKNKQPKM